MEKKIKNTLFLVVFVLCFTHLSYCQESNIRVEVTLTKKSVHPGENFVIHTKITNVGTEKQEFGIWACSRSLNYITDNNDVMPWFSFACNGNIPIGLALLPGEKFEDEFELRVAENAKPGSMVFRLGFRHCVTADFLMGTLKSTLFYTCNDKTVFWSDPITIKILSKVSLPASK